MLHRVFNPVLRVVYSIAIKIQIKKENWKMKDVFSKKLLILISATVLVGVMVWLQVSFEFGEKIVASIGLIATLFLVILLVVGPSSDNICTRVTEITLGVGFTAAAIWLGVLIWQGHEIKTLFWAFGDIAILQGYILLLLKIFKK